MSETRILRVAAVVLAALILLPSCSGDGTSVEPGSGPVTMTGSLTFPAGDQVDLEDVTIGMASSQVSADTNGNFSIVGNSNTPSMVIAYDQDTLPMLMSIVADPQEGALFEVNAHSTALALAFLCPFVCVSDPDGADEVLSKLEGLDEMEGLEDLIEVRLGLDPFALSVEDADTDSALSRVVLAYMSTYPDVMMRNYPSLAAAGTAVYVDPSYEKSGHEITYIKDNRFKLMNYLGRWAYCVTPTDSFYVWPNGTLLDALRLHPFKPSEREFELEVVANEPPVEVHLYGFGMAPDVDNVWDDLGPNDQIRAQYGGLSTFFFEFLPHVMSVISGVNKTVGSKEIADLWSFKVMKLMSSDARLMERTMMYLREGNMWGMGWFYTKWGIKKILSHDALGETLLRTIGAQITAEQMTLLAANLNVVARVVVTSDGVASVIKTFIGFRNSRFKTTFKVWKESVGFGSISGTVHDSGDGTTIEGVRVLLEGDEGNPMDPSHDETTSSSGAFFFSNIMAGGKTLQFSKTGYTATSLGVVVESGKTTTVAVNLGKDAGSVQGKIVNKILLHNGISPDNFQGACNLDATEIGGSGQTLVYTIDGGEYAKDIPPGNWRLIASHDLYWPDTVEVTVEPEEITEVPDLILYPRGRMEGQISFDMDDNGTWEKIVNFTAMTTAAGKMSTLAGPSAAPATSGYLQVLGAGDVTGGAPYDVLLLQIDLGDVTEPNYYSLGGFAEVLSPAYSVPAGLYYITDREMCYHPQAGYQTMMFIVSSEPTVAECNCDVTFFGSLTIEQFGTELTDVVSGGISAYLAGWKGCTCTCCEDVDGDGQDDDFVVDCAKAKLSLDFEVVVGSLLGSKMSDMLNPADEERVRELTGGPDE